MITVGTPRPGVPTVDENLIAWNPHPESENDYCRDARSGRPPPAWGILKPQSEILIKKDTIFHLFVITLPQRFFNEIFNLNEKV
jgi:hypothetical protein